MYKKILLYYHTIKYLKCVQVRYQIWYKLRTKWRRATGFKYNYYKQPPPFETIKWNDGIDNYISYLGGNEFEFLNLKYLFTGAIDWDFGSYGKLWTYYLNYFEYLNQADNIRHEKELHQLINDFVEKIPALHNANEPFPTSLRIINWIKYFSKNDIKDPVWLSSLYSQCYILSDNVEYHLLGNHLLENGYALTMAGIYFQDKQLYKQGKEILKLELEEQILDDGGHFELSPMYHCLMLYRLLDLIHLMQGNNDTLKRAFSTGEENYLIYLKGKASMMCGWIQAMMYDDGSYPHFNDSADGIAPRPLDLIEYALKEEVHFKPSVLGKSGYRRLKNVEFDLIAKCGPIGPDYIPGHAHADSLSFELWVGGKPLIVDTGISTYEKNEKRQYQRSTSAHNTVTISCLDTSEVWDGFRVGRRSSVMSLTHSEDTIDVVLSWPSKDIHIRKFKLEKIGLIITDILSLTYKNFESSFHISSDKIDLQGSHASADNIHFEFQGAEFVDISECKISKGYNKEETNKKIRVAFKNQQKTIIRFENPLSN